MRRSSQKGFTLIELLVVIAIIGLLSTLAVVALNSARQKARDSKRVADVKQIQTALELYFADKNGYPAAASAVTLGTGSQVSLCGDTTGSGTSGWKAACAGTDTTYMGLVPAAPTPVDGSCTAAQNSYSYTSASTSTYSLTLCLGGTVGDLTAGVKTGSPNGIQ